MKKILPVDLEAYIFSEVVSRLKGYEEGSFTTFNPLEGKRLKLGIGLSMVDGDHRHNYQRNLARRDRTKYICMNDTENSRVFILGEYVFNRREVKLFPNEGKKLGTLGTMITSKLHQLLDESYSFKKVYMVESGHNINTVETEWYGRTTVS